MKHTYPDSGIPEMDSFLKAAYGEAWIARKAMPCVRIGREWRFKKDEIDGWLRSGRAAKSETETAVARTGED